MSRIRADKFVNRAASGAPELTYGAQVVTGYGITGAGGINITGVATANSFSGNWSGALSVTDTTASSSTSTGALIVSGGAGIAKSVYVGGNLDVTGAVSVGGTVTYEDVTNVDSVGVVTARLGVIATAGRGVEITAGGLNVTAGIATFKGVLNADAEVTAAGGVDIEGGLDVAGITTLSGETRLTAISERLQRIDGNTVNLTYNSTGNNVGYCTNPTDSITLNVTGIPTSSSFDNQSLTFAVIVQQTGTARTCNAVKLNGVTKTVRWSGGTTGTGTTMSYDIFNFTGINTVGSATSAANYEVLGLVNGDFRRY